MKWQPIETAPKDGRPVWARGYNFGNPNKGYHYAWIYWDDQEPFCSWCFAGITEGQCAHLVEWMPLPPPPEDE